MDHIAARSVGNTTMSLILPFNREVTRIALTNVLVVERSCNYRTSSCYWDQAELNNQLVTANYTNWREVFKTLPKDQAFDNKD